MNKKITVAIAGLGSRGKDTYAPCAKLFPEKMKIVAIADKDKAKVLEVAKEYNIPPQNCFSSAEEMLKEKKLADAMFICTQDKQHVQHAIPALKKGYHLLLEKPISPKLEECNELLAVSKKYDRRVVVCHVLRYTPFYSTLKNILSSGKIGEIVTVMGIENVGYYHHAHSFVRGNWRSSEKASPMILAKCCHDMDLLLWLTGKKCKSLSSYGDIYLFKKENAPEGASERCLAGCSIKSNCPYDAEKIYLTDQKTGVLQGNKGWPNDVLTLHPSPESIREALLTGPYGRCVYHCDNDVVDHQVLNMNMTDGSTISFTMSAFTSTISRYTKFMGTKGEIIADMGANTIDVWEFGKTHETIDISKLSANLSGHGGGDTRMVEGFLDMLISNQGPKGDITSLENSLESHYIALAAEKSRLLGGYSLSIEDFKS